MDAARLDSLRIELDPVGQAFIALALFFIMLGVALGLKASDFRFMRERPTLFAGGVAAQVIGLPLVTFLLVSLVSPLPSIALGMMVVACCPGGSSSNLLTWLARGNVAYSVSITAASSLFAAVLTPASILFWSGLYAPTATLLDTIDVDPAAFLAQTTILLAVPLAIGMTLAARAPGFANTIRRPITLAGAIMLGGAIAYGLFYLHDTVLQTLPLILPIAALHNALAFTTGAAAGRALGADAPTRRALTFEVGIQNSGLAIVILLSQLKGLGGAAAIAAVWGVWHLIAGGAIVALFRTLDRRSAR